MLRLLMPTTTIKRFAENPDFRFNTGQWVKIDIDGKATLAGPTDIGLEQIYEGNLKIVHGKFNTVYGLYIGETDQYNKQKTYITDTHLSVHDGILDIAEDADKVIALVETILPNGFMRFKRV